jgi:predicted nucleic acid-binding protein
MMRRLTIYLETSVWNFVFAEDAPERRAAAERLFEQIERYRPFISVVVIEEIAKASPPKKDLLSREIKRYQPTILELTPEIIGLADEYIRRGTIPAKYRNDAFHVAFASYYDMDALVSFNFKHIVKFKTKVEVKAANLILGYHTPMIITPEELLADV